MNTLTKQRSGKSLILVTLVLIVLFAWLAFRARSGG